MNVAQPYDERVQRREEEIASLKEAMEILNGEGVQDNIANIFNFEHSNISILEYFPISVC